ncbi:hypothetical protein R3P38DRAFT_2771177 [Favolaschia claudopus]|uniref:Uncharacterized protein n=1 Tax=Favolaschia claudopus TaxID=2862362 RepID=A0AAW0CE98_9AGAR
MLESGWVGGWSWAAGWLVGFMVRVRRFYPLLRPLTQPHFNFNAVTTHVYYCCCIIYIESRCGGLRLDVRFIFKYLRAVLGKWFSLFDLVLMIRAGKYGHGTLFLLVFLEFAAELTIVEPKRQRRAGFWRPRRLCGDLALGLRAWGWEWAWARDETAARGDEAGWMTGGDSVPRGHFGWRGRVGNAGKSGGWRGVGEWRWRHRRKPHTSRLAPEWRAAFEGGRGVAASGRRLDAVNEGEGLGGAWAGKQRGSSRNLLPATASRARRRWGGAGLVGALQHFRGGVYIQWFCLPPIDVVETNSTAPHAVSARWLQVLAARRNSLLLQTWINCPHPPKHLSSTLLAIKTANIELSALQVHQYTFSVDLDAILRSSSFNLKAILQIQIFGGLGLLHRRRLSSSPPPIRVTHVPSGIPILKSSFSDGSGAGKTSLDREETLAISLNN